MAVKPEDWRLIVQLDGFEGRVALVTGAGRGIGAAIARRLASLGAAVAAGDLDAPDHPGIVGVEMDVTSESSVENAFGIVEERLGPVEVLILNAGIFRIEPFEETTLDSWSDSIAVNLTGAFLCARRALPRMRQGGYGRIVALGSSAGKTGGANNAAAYGASKAGVMALMKAIASQYAPYGITANALAPTLIDTDMIAGIRDMASRVPVGRLGRPEEVAYLVAFLASEHAGFITGEVTDINGGFLID